MIYKAHLAVVILEKKNDPSYAVSIHRQTIDILLVIKIIRSVSVTSVLYHLLCDCT